MPFSVEEGLQLAGLEHLADDVAAADELALDVKLRDGRPVGVFLDALAQLGRGQHVDALVVDAEIVEDLHDLAGEAALRKAGVPFMKSTTSLLFTSLSMKSLIPLMENPFEPVGVRRT